MTRLREIETPFAVVDRAKSARNIARLREHLDRLGVPLRLHVKTAKSIDVARLVHPNGPEPITVSTLAEAEYFADHGYTDIVYAVGIAATKLDRVVALRKRGVDLAVLLDSLEQAEAVAEASRKSGLQIPALIEIDCDGHRGGVAPSSDALLEIARILTEGGAEVRGVLDHAGESYFSYGEADQRWDADVERSFAVDAALRLREAGHPCPVVSVGSTPTAHAVDLLDGVTEVRAGNFVFFDLVMAGIGVCEIDDLALSVAVTVIGHRADKGWIMTDGGWMAMSRDRGTAAQRVDQGYGVVLTEAGEVIADLVMTGASQEHGILSLREGAEGALPEIAIGTILRILPNHACATAAQHARYRVVESVLTNAEKATGENDAESPEIVATWERIGGW